MDHDLVNKSQYFSSCVNSSGVFGKEEHLWVGDSNIICAFKQPPYIFENVLLYWVDKRRLKSIKLWCVCLCLYLVTQSCLTLQLLQSSLQGSSVHGTFQARIQEWVEISFSRGSSQPNDPTCLSCVPCVFCIAGRFFTHWVIGDIH